MKKKIPITSFIFYCFLSLIPSILFYFVSSIMGGRHTRAFKTIVVFGLKNGGQLIHESTYTWENMVHSWGKGWVHWGVCTGGNCSCKQYYFHWILGKYHLTNTERSIPQLQHYFIISHPFPHMYKAIYSPGPGYSKPAGLVLILG